MTWVDRLLRRKPPRPDTRTPDVLEKLRVVLDAHAAATERIVGPLSRLLTTMAKEADHER